MMNNIVLLSVMGLISAHLRAQDVSGLRPGIATSAAKDSTSLDTVRVYRLGEIVITATRNERNPDDVGRSISLITKEEMSNSMSNNVAELLSQREGLYIVGTGQNPGMLQSMFTRGASSNQTTVMIDEIRMTDPSGVNNAFDLAELSYAGTDRIEIVRGSHSTLYGSSAIGGTVNLVTEKFSNPGLHTNVALTTGSFGRGTSAISENLFLNYTDATGLYVNTTVYNSRVSGLNAVVDTITNPDAFKHGDKDGFDKTDIHSKLGFINGWLDACVSYKSTIHKTDIDKSAYTDDDNSTLDFRRTMLTYGASIKLNSEMTFKCLGGYSDMKRVAVDDSSIVDRAGNFDYTYFDGTRRGATFTNEIQGNLKLRNFEGVFGGGLYKETMTSQTYFYSASSFGVYEERTDLDTLKLSSSTKNIFAHIDMNGGLVDETFSPFSIALGARLNNHSTYGANMTYEINPSVRISVNALLYASYSTGFNAPSLYQLFAPDKNYVSGIARGNRNLRPENSASYEIGLKQTFGAGTKLTVAYFSTFVEDAIENVYLWDNRIGIDTLGNSWGRDDFRGDTYLNVGQQTTNGIEFTLSSRITDNLFLSSNVSLISGRLAYNPSSIDASQTRGNHVQVYSNGAFITRQVETLGLVRRPNTANFSFTYKPIETLALMVDMRYVGSRSDVFYSSKLGPFGALATTPVADYTLVDVSQRLDLGGHLSVGARLENVFDTQYSEINGFTTRGRGVYVSLRFAN